MSATRNAHYRLQRNLAAMRQNTKREAQDKIVAAICMEAFKADDAGNRDLGNAIRAEGTRLAKRWGIREIPGLPETFNSKSEAA